jgi:RNA ligase (TIGR02306 family)
MSEWHVETVRVGKVEKHPNADTLSVTQVHGGYPVIFRTGDMQEGDLAVYIPVDSIVPDVPQFAFLQKRRIKAKKLRGVYSQGLLIPVTGEVHLQLAPDGGPVTPGVSVHELLGITKWEPDIEYIFTNGPQEPGPEGWDFIKYTDIEGLRRYKNVLEEGEEVVITEKIHGCNGRFCSDGERLWVGSRNQVKKEDETTFWWKVAKELNLDDRLSHAPMTIFYGEVYGKGVQDLSYDNIGQSFIVFDTFDVASGQFNDWEKTLEMASMIGAPTVPVLYRGPWKGFEAHKELAEGKSTIAGHVREGFVVKPVKERFAHRFGRVILKLVGQGYLLRDG